MSLKTTFDGIDKQQFQEHNPTVIQLSQAEARMLIDHINDNRDDLDDEDPDFGEMLDQITTELNLAQGSLTQHDNCAYVVLRLTR